MMRKRWLRLIFAALLLMVGLVGVPAYWLNSYFNHLNDFIYYVKSGDQISAEKELDYIGDFVQKVNRWRVGKWLGNKYLFGEFLKYEAKYCFMMGDYNNVLNILKGRTGDNDPFIYDLMGKAKFRLAQGAYVEAKTRAKKKEIANMVLLDACEDFRKALQYDRDNIFDYVWNFDLCDPSKIGKALAQSKPNPVPQLGDDEGPGGKLVPGKNKNQGNPKEGEENKALPGGLDKPKKKG